MKKISILMTVFNLILTFVLTSDILSTECKKCVKMLYHSKKTKKNTQIKE